MSEETRRAVRAALEGYLRDGADPTPVRAAMEVLARDARDSALRAEQVLILLKEIWYTLPEVKRIRSPEQQSRLLQRVVTISIQAYYDVTPAED